MRYAIIQNNVVVNIAESEHPINENWILDATKDAQIGGTYDTATGKFFPPVIVAPPAPLPPLTKIGILKRVTPAQWHAFATSTDPDAVYGYAVFQAAPDPINRDDPLTGQLFGVLVQLGILSADDVAKVLA